MNRVNIDKEADLALLSLNIPRGFAKPLEFSDAVAIGERVVIVTANTESEPAISEAGIFYF